MTAASAALMDRAHLEASLKLNQSGMQQWIDAMAELGLDYIPSVGNFLCVDVGRPAAAVYEALLHEGVIVRPVANYGLPNHLRITLGLTQKTAAPSRRFAGSGMIRRLCIIGVGLIGGSLARALRKAGYAEEIVGTSRRAEHLQEAVDLGVIDRFDRPPIPRPIPSRGA